MMRVISILCLASVVALLSGPVSASLLPFYNLPFEDGTGAATIANFGSVGGDGVPYDGGTPDNGSLNNNQVTNAAYITPPWGGHALDLSTTAVRTLLLPACAATFERMHNVGDQMTVAAWICLNTSHLDGGSRVIMGDWTTSPPGGGTDNWHFFVTATGHLNIMAGHTFAQVTSTQTIADGVWTHVAFTWEVGSNPIEYINGVPVTTTNTISTSGTDAESNTIPFAGSLRLTGGYLNGAMDNLLMYDRVLSPTEIQALVPEPATISLLALGALAMLRRKRGT